MRCLCAFTLTNTNTAADNSISTIGSQIQDFRPPLELLPVDETSCESSLDGSTSSSETDPLISEASYLSETTLELLFEDEEDELLFDEDDDDDLDEDDEREDEEGAVELEDFSEEEDSLEEDDSEEDDEETDEDEDDGSSDDKADEETSDELDELSLLEEGSLRTTDSWLTDESTGAVLSSTSAEAHTTEIQSRTKDANIAADLL